MTSDKKITWYIRVGQRFVFLSFLLASCGNDTSFFNLTVKDEVNNPAQERPTGVKTGTNKKSSFDLSKLNVYLDNFLLNETNPVIRVEGLISGASLKLREGGCGGEVVSSLDHDGTFSNLPPYESYIEIQYYIELNYQGNTECKVLEKNWVHLLTPTLSLNEEQTALDKRKPQFDVVNLFPEKEVQLSLYENDSCSGEPLSQVVSSSTGSATVGLEDPLSDLNTHTYYVKQSYKGVSICSQVGVEYAYSLEVENLSLRYDDVILGGSEGVVEVAKVLPGSTVSLHKESCNTDTDDSISEDGVLTPATTNGYTDIPLYVKYSYDQTSVCSEIDSRYVYLEKAVLNLNSAQTALHKRTPTFNVSNLYSGKNVAITLYESASCAGSVVSETVSTDTGSATISISSELTDSNTHSYYLKQSYAGVSSCSEGIQYTYGLDISDLTITSDPILFGASPASITVTGMIPGSSVSIHKGSCEAAADDTISEDGTLTPTPTNTYTETDIYLKYTLNQGSSCQSIGVSYLNLVFPVLSLNSAQTNLDRRSPKFNASNLFTGKNVTVVVYESSNCSGGAVSATVNSSTGSALLTLSSALTDINSHTYSVKQSYQGHSSCSNSLAYQYSIDTQNLGIVADDILFGATPGSVTITKMISGSTVSLHKGSCNAEADASITEDGTLTPVSTGSYNHTQLYVKYTKAGSTDCDPIDSYYLYLEQATLSLNSSQTDQHPLTPTFNVNNLYSGKTKTISLYNGLDCTGSVVRSATSTTLGSTTISPTEALSSTTSYNYSVAQTYEGYTTCSNAVVYQYEIDVDNLLVETDSVLYGDTPESVSISQMIGGSTVSLHKGSCNSEAEALITEDGNLVPTVPDNYQEEDLYLKYTFNEVSDCASIGSKYLYLKAPTLALNSESIVTDARKPSFNVSDLYEGKEKSVTLYYGRNCNGSVIANNPSTTLGSVTIPMQTPLVTMLTNEFSVAQTYNGYTTCSNELIYKYDIDVDNLGLTYDDVINGKYQSNITVSKILSDSTVSIHKGSCEGIDAGTSIHADGVIKTNTASSYEETDIYLKYEKIENDRYESDCKKLDTMYIVLEQPGITLNEAFTNKLIPEFDIDNLFTGKNVTVTLHTNNTCTSDPVSNEVQTDTGSATIARSSAITATGTTSYYAKQSYAGLSSCSAIQSYTYNINVSNLVLNYDSVQYGTNPAGISVSNMIAGSTVYLYKNSSCNGTSSSITSDGIIYPVTSSGNSQSSLSLKYYKSSSDCLPNFATYLSLATPGLTLNTSQTNQHRLTPTFNVTNLYSAKSPTVAIYEDSTCSGVSVTTPVTSTTTSKTLTLATELSDNNNHTYYAGQTYMGYTSCSEVLNYKVVDINNLTVTTPSILSGNNPKSISVSSMMPDSTVSLHKGSCNSEADDSITSNGSLTPVPVNEAIEVDLYLKYTHELGTDCKKISKYINFNPITSSLNSSLTSSDPSRPGIDVSGLIMAEDTVTVTLHLNPECTDITRSEEVETDTGSATLQQINSLIIPGLHKYYVKETYHEVSVCFATGVEYRYNPGPQFQAFLHEQGGYPSNQNRGIIVKNTTVGNKIKLYTGTSCTDPASLVTTVRTTQGTTDIETPTLTDGTYKFSFLELDSEDNEIGCFTSSEVTMIPRRAVDAEYVYAQVDNIKRNVEISHLKTQNQNFSENIKNMYINSYGAIALLFEDESVRTAGNRSCGGDSSSVASSIDGTIPVTAIYSTDSAFAALRNDGSVITWGDSNGGNSSSVASKINGTIPVTTIYSTDSAFAALRNDGSVVTWGASSWGGNSSSVASSIDGTIPVTAIYSTDYAFAALRSDGSVVTWGASSWGGSSSSVASSIDGTIPVTAIYSTNSAFAALRNDGSVITWGNSNGGNSSSVASKINGTIPVTTIYSTGSAFAALRSDGSVVTWGESSWGGSSSSVASSIDGTIPVTAIYSTDTAFAALRNDGSVITWGDSNGGNSSSVANSIDGTIPVTTIYSTSSAFAALRNDGSVITWGNSTSGGSSSSVASSINGTIPVTLIYSSKSRFIALRNDDSFVIWPERSLLQTNITVTATSYTNMSTPDLNSNATALLKTDGSVVTFGYSGYGGDISSVASQIDGTIPVTAIYSTSRSFGALRGDGSVVTWGSSVSGGNSSSVANKLNGSIPVTTISSTGEAFAALRNDGSVITWGDSYNGADSSSVATSIDGTIPVTAIYSTDSAFAALRNDGSVVTWGNSSSGGSSSSVANSIDGTTPVTAISSTSGAFAALRNDGSVVTWGSSLRGGNSSSVANSIDGTIPVTTIYSIYYRAFAALRSDGSVVTWGDSSFGGNSSSVASSIDGTIPVTAIYSTAGAFAALRNDGSVVTWGQSNYGGDSSSVANKINGTIPVTAIYSSAHAFAALRNDGSVVTWGDSSSGGSSSSVASSIDGTIPVTAIYSTQGAFAALRSDGSVVTWGNSTYGGNSSEVTEDINGDIDVTSIFITHEGFLAQRSNGTIVVWGLYSLKF